jgi:hypothetical protein
MFQVLYTLKCFELVKLAHNDLHAGNIFIDELEIPERRTYHISTVKHVVLVIKYDVKIFDFDRGTVNHPGVERNFNLDIDFCKSFGQCAFMSGGDLSGFLSVILSITPQHAVITQYIASVVSPAFLIRLNNRLYKQNHHIGGLGVPLKRDPDPIKPTDMYSIDKCIEVLLTNQSFTSSTVWDTIPNDTTMRTHPSTIYRLPVEYVPVTGPVRLPGYVPSTFVHIQRPHAVMDTTNLKNIFYMYTTSNIIANNLYDREFGRRATRDEALKIMNVLNNNGLLYKDNYAQYSIASYLLCIPFIHKLNIPQLVAFMNLQIVFVLGGVNMISSDMIIECMNNIWRITNGELPVSIMIL